MKTRNENMKGGQGGQWGESQTQKTKTVSVFSLPGPADWTGTGLDPSTRPSL